MFVNFWTELFKWTLDCAFCENWKEVLQSYWIFLCKNCTSYPLLCMEHIPIDERIFWCLTFSKIWVTFLDTDMEILLHSLHHPVPLSAACCTQRCVRGLGWISPTGRTADVLQRPGVITVSPRTYKKSDFTSVTYASARAYRGRETHAC